ncbi:MAG TPA: type II secretion system secretin GspD [Pseudobdellovibrionaceae bacterium]|nr:type II secretion system secretin GspD [Pseudobdellovibrionaceae bacterium]
MKYQHRLLFIVALLITLNSHNSKAQFDDVPPPPPIPESNGDEFSEEAESYESETESPLSKSSEKKQEVLTKKEKDKFSRAATHEISDADYPETIESFDFPNVDITDVVKAISELTGKNFIIDPGVKGKITIIAPSKITVAEAYRAFLSALAIHHYTIVPSGGFLKIKRARDAQKDSIDTYSGSYYPNTDQIITRIVHLKYISAEQVQKELVRFLHTADGDMAVYSATNSLVISDYGSNIDRIMKILNQLDVPGFEEQMKVIQIRNAKAKDLADLIDRIVNKGQSSQNRNSGSFGSGIPRFTRTGSGGQQGAMYFMAIPDDRTNSIIAVGNKAGILRVKQLIAQLDFRMKPDENGGVYVYYVKYGDAEKIAQTLSGVTKDSAPKSGGAANSNPMGMPGGAPIVASATEIFGGEVKISADKNTNSLVVTAARSDYEMVLNLLEKLDIPRDQVFVEAYILEMNASDGANWGVGYYRYGDSGYGKSGFNGGMDLASLLSPTGGQGAVLGFGSNQTVKVTDPVSKSEITIPNLIGFINFLKNVKKANILSTPQILAMDNEEAYIDVGNKVATRVNTTTTATGTTYSPELEDATIKLTIKPFISPSSESIRMELKQEVKQISNVTLPKNLQDNSQPLAKREIKTNVVVNNGDTIVLGGLIQEQEKEVVSKVPFLGDIPVIGWLFKSKDLLKEKVNMLTLLSPRIIRNSDQHRKVLTEKLEDRVGFVKEVGGTDPFGEKLNKLITRSDKAKAEATTNSNKVSTPIQKKENDKEETPSENEDQEIEL